MSDDLIGMKTNPPSEDKAFRPAMPTIGRPVMPDGSARPAGSRWRL
jgi:hypothetical protein